MFCHPLITFDCESILNEDKFLDLLDTIPWAFEIFPCAISSISNDFLEETFNKLLTESQLWTIPSAFEFKPLTFSSLIYAFSLRTLLKIGKCFSGTILAEDLVGLNIPGDFPSSI